MAGQIAFHEAGGGISPGRLRSADKIVKERVDASDSELPAEEVRVHELRTIHHHVGLLIDAECLTIQEDFYGEVPAFESPEGHHIHVLTMKGHQLLERLRDDSGGDGDIGFATS